MPTSIPLSVRITDEDAEFLATYDAPGARTPSEKIRSLLAAARKRKEGAQDFAAGVELVEDMMRPALHAVRTAQATTATRSEFVLRLYERIPELVAELVSAHPESDPESLTDFEARLADVIFALIEEILDMGLTSKSRSYDPALIRKRMDPILEILELLRVARKNEKGHPDA